MKVAHRALKKYFADTTEDGIPNPSILPWHGSRLNSAFETISHDQVIALTHLGYKGFQIGEIITPVRVTHDHVLALGSTCGPQDCSTITPDWNRNYSCSHVSCNFLRTIG